MRIAVDARPLAHPATGIGRYTEAVLRRLVNTGHQWFLYSDREITPRFPLDDHVQLRQGHVRPGSPLSIIHSQLVFPRWARGDCVDIFWSPRHHLPVLLPAGIKSVVTVHDVVWKRYPETMRRANHWLERCLMGPSLRRADSIISVSDFTARELAHYWPHVGGRCQTIYEAADNPPQSYEESIPLPGSAYLLFVGTPEPRKNLPVLLRAYAEAVHVGGLEQELVLVGAGGWGSFDLNREIAALELGGRVHIRGRVSDAELQALYAGATALLMPSLYEGFGLPVLEAMVHGTPVIVSNRGALPEVVGEAGIVVEPDSIAEIAAAMVRLDSDAQIRQSLVALGKSRAALFQWDEISAQTLQVFEALLAGSAGAKNP